MNKIKEKIAADIRSDKVTNVNRWARHITDTLTKEEVKALSIYLQELLNE